MGYTEPNCVICGSRFNIARLRRTDEPLNMAWDVHRDYWRAGSDPNGDEGQPDANIIVPKMVNGSIVGYECDGEFHGNYVEGEGIKPDSACAQAGCSEEEGDHACGGPSCGLVAPSRGHYHQSSGYNGWLIDVEEMKIMTCVQAAVPNENPDNWQSEHDDDEFEHRDLILSAVSESAPDEFEVTHVPYRHGIGGSLLISDVAFETEWGVPFHGPCYQVLKRRAKYHQSYSKLQLLDSIQALRESGREPNSESEDVDENIDQWWMHKPGTEYLAADPYHIPALDEIFEECIRKTAAAPDAYIENVQVDQSNGSKDPFARYPPELRLLILDLLDYKDVAHLRLASRMFRILPQRFFRDVIRERMPWVWEIDEKHLLDKHMDWLELWSKLTQADGGKGKGRRGLSFKLEKPELGRGNRVNGLVNRRRVWEEASSLLEIMSEFEKPSHGDS